ncbi:SIMPL domain-containing protein [Nocardioides sp. SR21]|uniref:SIMPL domain-containing protein n=1 Tax=Nocardioides sp. SR21 TaxID=2919501 RepID=UPI001FA9F104|nr:SIMPL domain-containing protein [Nocardioides sp. SR21]
MTVSVRSILVTVVVVLALLVAFLLGGAGGGGTPAQADDGDQPDAEQPRILTMTGSGDASAVPDQLSFDLGVTVVRDDLEAALAAASTTMDRVLATLADQEVAKGDVQTTGLSMSPVYQYHQYDPPTITGYRVAQHATVIVRDLKRGGAAVTAAVGAGGNDVRVGDIKLLVGDTDAVMKRAREAAVAEATAKAEEYAAASGQALGDVLTLREVRVKPVPTATYARAGYLARDEAVATVPIRAGKETGTVTVQVVWALAG